jgi:hypothetical protein
MIIIKLQTIIVLAGLFLYHDIWYCWLRQGILFQGLKLACPALLVPLPLVSACSC